MTLLIFYALLAVGVSFICSLLEASLLSVPMSYVQVQADQGSRAAKRLQQMKQDIDRPLSAILTLNTIAHTIGAAGVGAQVAVIYDDRYVGLASAIMTLLILVLSEIIPKTLGVIHTKRLSAFTAMATSVLMVLCYPIIIVLEWMNRWIGGKRDSNLTSRAELIATIQLGHRGGALNQKEFSVLMNLLALRDVKVKQVLTPRMVVFALPADQQVDKVIGQHRPIRFSRIPIYGESPDQVSGYITRYDLQHAQQMDQGGQRLSELARPIEVIPEQASVADALNQALASGEHIMLVVDEFGGMEGIVTLEDLIETLLGVEIVDETDAVADMQQVARRLAKRRQRHVEDQ